MNIQQLVYLMELKRYGSINRTAQAMHISQPWLSKTLKELEEELQVELYLRSSKGITITEDGERLIERVAPLIQELDFIKNQYDERNDNHETIHLTVSSGRYSFMTKAFITYSEQYVKPAVEADIHINEGSCAQAVEDVYGKRSEIGIIHVNSESGRRWQRQLDSKTIEYHYMFSCQMCVYLRKGHPLLSREFVSIEDLCQYPLIFTTGKDSPFNNYDEEPNNVPYQSFLKKIYASSRHWAYSVLESTDSIYLGLSNCAAEEMNQNLTSIAYPGESISFDLYWLKLKNHILSPEMKLFLNLLVDTCA